jgi:RHS repeat-associated protein
VARAALAAAERVLPFLHASAHQPKGPRVGAKQSFQGGQSTASPAYVDPIETGARWLLTDHYSVRRVVDADGDAVGGISDISYSAFGKFTSTATPETLNTIVGYTGQVFDLEMGLHYFKARYYDPASGRFLSEDPSGFASGNANRYRYVGNNPINATGLAGRCALQR